MTHTEAEAQQIPEQTPEEIEHDRKVTESRKALWENLAAAQDSLQKAIGDLNDLSNGSWDAEYESPSEIMNHVRECDRLVRVTRAILPTDENGDHVSSDHSKTIHALRSDGYLK